jgi:hypothetical protein
VATTAGAQGVAGSVGVNTTWYTAARAVVIAGGTTAGDYITAIVNCLAPGRFA